MSFGEEFRKTHGPGTPYRPFEKADRGRLASIVPDFMLEQWEADGWASYRDGLLWTVDPHEYAPLVAAWKLPYDDLAVVARTALGELYLLGTLKTQNGGSAQGVIGLNPHKATFSIVGARPEKFFTRTLAKEDYAVAALQEPEAKRAANAAGPVAWNEMYGYEPALALGGSGAPETIRRYNIFNHHLLLSQLGEATLQKF